MSAEPRGFRRALGGASQSDTDAAIRSLTPADFAIAVTADGKPFPSDLLKPSSSNALSFNNWRLQSQGDGKYLVFSGSDQARQYLGSATYSKGRPVLNGKFVLDLGAKREAAERSMIPPLARIFDLPFGLLPVW